MTGVNCKTRTIKQNMIRLDFWKILEFSNGLISYKILYLLKNSRIFNVSPYEIFPKL